MHISMVYVLLHQQCTEQIKPISAQKEDVVIFEIPVSQCYSN